MVLSTACAALLTACASAPSEPVHLYRLPSLTAEASPSPRVGSLDLTCASPSADRPDPSTATPALWVLRLPVQTAAHLDRTRLVVREGPALLRELEDRRWAEPLRDGIARGVREDLQALAPGCTVVVTTVPPGAPDPSRRITLTIDRLDADTTHRRVDVEARWTVEVRHGEFRWGQARYAVPIPTRDPSRADGIDPVEELVLAQRQALSQLSRLMLRELAP